MNAIAHRSLAAITGLEDPPNPADDDPTASGVLSLPWADLRDWREAHGTLQVLFRIHDRRLNPLREAARQARGALEEIGPVLDRFARLTCPECRAVCCRMAQVAFDFKDLVWMHALDLDPPPHQLRRHDAEVCRYLGDHGCRLPRVVRPFICNWYLCAAMLDLYYALPPREQRRFSAGMSFVQQTRRFMEAELILVTVSADAEP